MFKRLFPGLVISSLVIAGVVWGQISGRAFEQETPRVPIRAEARPGTYELPLNSAVALQLFALERHARVDMILYGSGSSGWQLASIASAPTVVALGVSTGR